MNLELDTTARERNARRLRLCELALVLAVAFALPLFSSTYALLTGEVRASRIDDARILGAVISEATALAVFFYVLFRQGRSVRELGLQSKLAALLPNWLWACGLTFFALLVSFGVQLTMTWCYHAVTGQRLDWQAQKAPVILVSITTVFFMLLNGFFEEILVRAFAITEVEALTKNTALAVIFSVLLQTSYHFYQGAPAALSHLPVFLVYSLFYVRTRNIWPIVLSHAGYDLILLLHYSALHAGKHP